MVKTTNVSKQIARFFRANERKGNLLSKKSESLTLTLL